MHLAKSLHACESGNVQGLSRVRAGLVWQAGNSVHLGAAGHRRPSCFRRV